MSQAKAEPQEMQEVLYDVSDHVATITLNAPDRMNTISATMLNQLTERLKEADADPEVRCVILTGADAPSAPVSTFERRRRAADSPSARAVALPPRASTSRTRRRRCFRKWRRRRSAR